MIEVTTPTSLFETLVAGGWVMVPLLSCSLVSLTVILERLMWGPKRERVMPARLEKEAYHLLTTNRIDELLGICRADDSPLARVLLVGLRNASRPRSEIIEAMQSIGKREAFQLQRNLGVLGTIAAVSPLLGLLGTVFGMISTFHVISEHGTGNPGLMAGGIAEALVTTATGLTVAIPSLLFYRYFLQQARKLIVEMEAVIMTLIDEIQGATVESVGAPLKGRGQ